MTLEEALAVAKWEPVTASHMQPGCYVVWSVPYGTYCRTWPNGDGCTFIPYARDEAADWQKLNSGWKGT